MKPIEIPFLSRSNIIGLDLGLDEVLNAVEQAMCEHSASIVMAVCHIALGQFTLPRAREKGIGRSFPLN